MKKIIITVIGIVTASLLFAQEAKEEKGFDIQWKNGFKVISRDGNFSLSFGGRIMFDAAFFFQDKALENTAGKLKNGVEFRRARLYHAGQVYKKVRYKFQIDFAGGKVSFKDMYMEVVEIPGLGAIRVGHFKEPFRLENLTSSKYITFMERAFPIEFMPERNSGLMIYNEVLNERLGWQIGVFRNADAFGNDKDADGGYNVTARISGLPWKHAEKPRLFHLGVGYSYRRPTSKEYEIATTPEAHLANDYVSTGTIKNIDAVHMLGEEAALVAGPFSFQAEMVHAFISSKTDSTSNDYHFCSLYGQVSYFLTGESRNYKDSYEGFDRIIPKKNLGKGGAGAWEVALRYSRINLDSDNIQGGQLGDITLGLNWYLNPVARVMFNYVFANVKGVGYAHIVQSRFQIDF